MSVFKTLAILTSMFIVNAAHAELLINDNFNNNASGWPNFSASSSRDMGFAVIENGKYQLTPVQDRAYGVVAAPKQAKNGDVRLQSTFFMYAGLGAGGAGLVCRMKDMQNFYAFMVLGTGEWRISKADQGKVTVLTQGKVGGQVMAGAVDAKMTAECKGSQLTLSLAGRQVGSVRDSRFNSGKSGLFVAGEEAAGTSASFDSFSLDALN